METCFRCPLLLAQGDFSDFVTRPLSLVLLIASLTLIVLVALPAIRSTRKVAFQES